MYHSADFILHRGVAQRFHRACGEKAVRARLVRSVASDDFLIARVGHSHSFWISIGDFCDSSAISSGQADSVKIRADPDRSATTSANVATQSWNLKQ